MPLESKFQKDLVDEIQELYPGAIILKQDPNYIQGFPDWLILNGPRWAALEAKRAARARSRPNQSYWVKICNEMSFGSFVFPENREEVLRGLQHALRPTR